MFCVFALFFKFTHNDKRKKVRIEKVVLYILCLFFVRLKVVDIRTDIKVNDLCAAFQARLAVTLRTITPTLVYEPFT